MKRTFSPTTVIILFISLFLLSTLVATLAALSGYAIPLGETQIMYLFSTSAQVIAAIYGLTLTGFVFLRNELNREEFEDETLADAVETLKARYFALLVFITVLVGFTLLLANLAIAYEGADRANLYALIINGGQSAFLTSLCAISYFIFDVLSPQRIARASRTVQNKVDPAGAGPLRGNLEEFLRNYNEIEMLIEDAGQPYQDISGGRYEKRYPRRLPTSRLAEILLRNERIGQQLFARLRELISLRNSIIHGADPVVSQAIVEVSRDVLRELRVALNQEPR
jgi:hypothetical protein